MRKRKCAAFTLIELLVVVGILILLVGIAAFGLSKVINSGKRSTTKVTLENLKSMLSEYEMVAKGLPPKRMWTPSGSTMTGDVWYDANPLTPLKDAMASPKNGFNLELNAGGPAVKTPRYSSLAIFNTQLVFEQLLTAANNKKVQAQFPQSQLIEKIPPGLTGCFLLVGSTAQPYAGVSDTANPPLILDAWGNPIVFVPGAGLFDVVQGDNTIHRQVPTVTIPTPSVDGPIKSPDGRPFWASAGPDGVLGYVDLNNNGTYDVGTDIPGGDDNMYSFEN